MNGVELAEQVGVSYRQVDHWSRAGYLRPSNPGCGQGRRREFSSAEVAVAAKLARLVRAGVSPAAAARVARGDEAARVALVRAVESALGWSA